MGIQTATLLFKITISRHVNFEVKLVAVESFQYFVSESPTTLKELAGGNGGPQRLAHISACITEAEGTLRFRWNVMTNADAYMQHLLVDVLGRLVRHNGHKDAHSLFSQDAVRSAFLAYLATPPSAPAQEVTTPS